MINYTNDFVSDRKEFEDKKFEKFQRILIKSKKIKEENEKQEISRYIKQNAKVKKLIRGGGEEGKEKRKAPKEGKKNVFIACKICFTEQPSLKSMQIHYENKHPKEDWEGIKESYQAQIDWAQSPIPNPQSPIPNFD